MQQPSSPVSLRTFLGHLWRRLAAEAAGARSPGCNWGQDKGRKEEFSAGGAGRRKGGRIANAGFVQPASVDKLGKKQSKGGNCQWWERKEQAPGSCWL